MPWRKAKIILQLPQPTVLPPIHESFQLNSQDICRYCTLVKNVQELELSSLHGEKKKSPLSRIHMKKLKETVVASVYSQPLPSQL
ncbi:hypothetical protein SK128_001202, partial [Halocaridina rubra]